MAGNDCRQLCLTQLFTSICKRGLVINKHDLFTRCAENAENKDLIKPVGENHASAVTSIVKHYYTIGWINACIYCWRGNYAT